MLRSGSYSSIDKASRRKLWTCLFGGTFEGEMRKEGKGGIGRYGAGKVVGGGMVDCGEDDIAGLGYVLYFVRGVKHKQDRDQVYSHLPCHCCVLPI